ncbi:MAG: 16S rRNA (adenine(1518)-N(6)/adenine(1519)-N(6))-dimethyltransferase RsmA [Planctomycetota bacterium]|nr:16S rRNA (adenine(1518)-N(6)/adenine(1519)-N(6))-dimethyltransferase RsmA [Planctomycetota bacterium]
MQTLTQIREMLEARGLSPRHSFGQNFLLDHNLIRKLVDASGVGPGDLVLEIGPGTGTLTELLLARRARVVACEIDRGLAALLRERLGHDPNFTLVEGDCLDGKHALNPALLGALGDAPFTLVANLPYGAGTPVMTILLADVPRCRGVFVTVQLEVARRLAAGPGGREYGPISVLAQAVGEVRLLAKLPPECFWPRPDVMSAMVQVVRRAEQRVPDPRALVDFAQRLFEQRRKQLGAILGRDRPFPAGISAEARAESLRIEQFETLRVWDRARGPDPATTTT